MKPQANKWVQALVIVLAVWLVMLLGQSAWNQGFVSWVPNLMSLASYEERNETLTWPAAELESFWLQSANGSITLLGQEDADKVIVEVTYRARGSGTMSASKTLEAMSTTAELKGGQLKLEPAVPSRYNGSVTYRVTLPGDLVTQAKTSNGSIEAEGLSGSVKLNSSNGRISVVAAPGLEKLEAHTSNGSIRVESESSEGRYDLRTSNGSIHVRLLPETGVAISARTSNGSVNLGSGQWFFEGGQITKTQVSAQRGSGELELILQTSNGSITLSDR